ncbi:hypothetical protein CK516_05585 [Nostoc sp. 'Peltigera malacea cyanobiont' DB3992]|nr:hypothetical protein CK516_05585 [Nostoc sp. 'Peltigera malacea cyanobiont' DB3992]
MVEGGPSQIARNSPARELFGERSTRMGVQANAKEFWSSASGQPYVTVTLDRDGEVSLKRSNKATTVSIDSSNSNSKEKN